MITDKRSHWSIEGFVEYSLDWGERVVRRREVNPSQISRQMQVLGMGGRYLQIFPRRYLQYLQYLRTQPRSHLSKRSDCLSFATDRGMEEHG